MNVCMRKCENVSILIYLFILAKLLHLLMQKKKKYGKENIIKLYITYITCILLLKSLHVI